jgi:hypothetical protein
MELGRGTTKSVHKDQKRDRTWFGRKLALLGVRSIKCPDVWICEASRRHRVRVELGVLL